MDLKARAAHFFLSLFYAKKRQDFDREKKYLQKIQTRKLRQILSDVKDTETWKHLDGDMTYEAFTQNIPISSYQDFSQRLTRQKETGKNIISPAVVRWEPTSGSTQSRKWIPYSKAHLNQMNAAAAVWLGDLYTKFPAIKGGKHYWSLSWLPEDLREHTTANDDDLFPFYQRWLLKSTMAMPAGISMLPKALHSRQATALILLAETELRFVFVWSPTFFLQIIEYIHLNWNDLVKNLNEGSWGPDDGIIKAQLGKAPVRNFDKMLSPDWKKIWPRLNLISAWDSSSSYTWAQKLKSILPWVNFQAKGLWATEGVVTIPIENQKALAFQSHFYEFIKIDPIDQSEQMIVPSWGVEVGQQYQPVISSSNGLLRYKLPDLVKCTGFLDSIPCFEFLNRIHSVDLVGEKISVSFVENLFSENKRLEPVCLLACHIPQPHYVLVCSNPESRDFKPVLLDEQLKAQHHYRVARELNQLHQAKIHYSENPVYLLSQIRKNSPEGQIKMDILLEVKHQVPL